MTDDRDGPKAPEPHHDEVVVTSGWLEGTFADDVGRGELGSIGPITLVATPGSVPEGGWVTIVDTGADALYGTYRLDGTGVVTLVIVGGTGKFSGAGGSLVGSRDVKRPRWWLSGSLTGLPHTRPPPDHNRCEQPSEHRDPSGPTT